MLTYRITVPAPATSTSSAKQFEWTADSEIVQSIDLDLHREHKRISTLNVRLWDPRQGLRQWPLYNALPDPAFTSVPLQLYLADATKTATPTLVFDGKIASLQPGYPGPSHTSIVAHDKSIDARRQARYKTYHNQSSLQIATQIAQDYGLTVDISQLRNLTLTQRAIDIGMSTMGLGHFSDWDHLSRALAVDGLELYMKGAKLYVRESALVTYPTTFTPDDGNVISMEVTTNYVGVPGAGGQAKGPQPGGNKGSVPAATGSVAAEAVKEGSTNTTHRSPPAGAKSGHAGAHTESKSSLTAYSAQRRKRKDEATLTMRLTPDIGMQHLIALSGWGLKIDGTWYIESIHHSIAGTAGTTSVHLTTVPTTGSKAQAGIVEPGGNR
jgi:hypothetical protein